MEPLPYDVWFEVYYPRGHFMQPKLCAALTIVDSAPDGVKRVDVHALAAEVVRLAGDVGLPDRRVCVTIYRCVGQPVDHALLAAHIWAKIAAVPA